jgi:hypothetical protein
MRHIDTTAVSDVSLFGHGAFTWPDGIIDKMSATISTLARCVVPVTVALVASAVPAGADGGTFVPMASTLRSCDFSRLPGFSSASRGTASAVIHAGGGAVTADIHLAEPTAPGAHYDVALIQLPHPSNVPCEGPGPGVAIGGLDSDGMGIANVTVRDGLRSGTTGVWVFIRQVSPRSQSPAELYTSDYPVPV